MIAAFVQTLFDHGNVRVAHPEQPIAESEWAQASNVLGESELIYRTEFPGDPPTFVVPAAQWATRALYRACQAMVYRDLPAESFSAFFSGPPPACEDSSLHYSVDLMFRFLPDLSKWASQISSDDPLLTIFQDWANLYPLSSVGMKNVMPRSLNGILTHSVLLQYYADRVIARRDATRLSHPLVQQAVQRAIGWHQDLFPEFASHLT